MLALLLGRAVQKEALIGQIAVLPYELDIAHDIEDIAVAVSDAVFHADAVALLLQGLDGAAEGFLVRIHHGGCHHVEASFHQLLLGFVAQDIQS